MMRSPGSIVSEPSPTAAGIGGIAAVDAGAGA
jgi:hypothetical protein